MAKAAAAAGAQMKKQNRVESDRAVDAMQKRGLKVYRPTPEIQEQWRKAAEACYAKIRGGLVPAEFFDDVKRLLAEYRAPSTKAAVLLSTAPRS